MKKFLVLLFGLLGFTLLPAATPGDVTRETAVDRPAPALMLKDLAGNKVSLASFKGKVVIVDFWATWCVPCKEEIPGYIELQKKYRADGLVIIGVSLDTKKPAAIQRFVEEVGINYIVVRGALDAMEAFGTEPGADVVFPTTFLINRAGRIIHQKQGLMEPAKYEAIVKAAL